ncbi:N-acetyltransferase, partial [Klebsiella pneumoniae]|nr:N-acetyltransferase [Klebsiella pneumoniae]
MSDIVIRHAEPKDIDAIRQIHAQPVGNHNTLPAPHPSE